MSSPAAPADRPHPLLVEPKLMLPRVQPGTLRRSRLLEMLDGDDGAALTVVNAPVGYGKTTLVRSWCVERPEPVVWLTLDAADEDPVRLWAHLATAVERLGEGLGGRALMALGARGAPVETAVDELMNGLVAYGGPVTIVLDDLDAVGSERSLRSIAHAIERLPANARLVACTRSDPAISLARLRARGALREIRVRELAFTVDEAQELLEREGIELSGESVELLLERTEGWPAGLYLAALWLRDLEDPDEGVRAFAGSARHVGDYLTAEVLTALPPETRDFLVQTSVLGRFTPGAVRRGPRPRGLGCGAFRARPLEHVPGRSRRARGVVSLSPSVRRAAGARARARGRAGAAPARRGLVPCAGARRGRDRVRRRRWGR